MDEEKQNKIVKKQIIPLPEITHNYNNGLFVKDLQWKSVQDDIRDHVTDPEIISAINDILKGKSS